MTPDGKTAAAPTPALETAIGSAAVLALVGFLLFAAMRGEGRGPPEVRLETAAPAHLGQTDWVVLFCAVNGGQAPASQLVWRRSCSC